jgi:pimeloyl-ACP methyl ester carboxylesterase
MRLWRRGLVLILMAVAAAGIWPGVAEAGSVRFVDVGQIRMAYRVSGEGRPLVLIPGSGMAMDVWDPLFLRRLSQRHRVIVFDPRGVGLSSGVGTRLTIQRMGDDTAGLIRALHLDHPDVMGWSMGGFVAEKLAVRHPRLIRRLVLASSDVGGSHAIRASAAVLALDEKVTLGQASLDEILALLFPPEGLQAGGAWLQRVFSQPGCCETVPTETAVQEIAAEDLWYAPRHGVYSRLPTIRQMTLVIDGKKDIDVPIANAHMLDNRIPNVQLKIFHHAGHAFLFQYPIRVADRVTTFLQSPD